MDYPDTVWRHCCKCNSGGYAFPDVLYTCPKCERKEGQSFQRRSKASKKAHKKRRNKIEELEATLAQRDAELTERLRAALGKYGQHEASCRTASGFPCTCGLAAALKDTEPEGSQTKEKP